jgi:class 3 adenylate cyclase
MEVGGWLRSLGLEQYESVFRENEIDGQVVPELTESDLEKLGLPLGHRKRLLKAIAALAATTPPTAGPAASPEGTARDSAERRQLTVMFCDLVGSTALSTKLDPEDLRSVVRAYHKCVAATVARFDGFLAKYMGDGVLIYFGYPRAHEDDAERAVRAGLALTELVPTLQTGKAAGFRFALASRRGWWLSAT